MSDNKELYLTPKETSKEVGISVYLLRYYRQQGHLPKTKWTPGGGKPLYEIISKAGLDENFIIPFK